MIYKGDPYDKRTLEQIPALRDAARTVAATAGGTVLIGGPTAMQADTWAISNHDTILVAIIALIVVGVILALLLRALLAPLLRCISWPSTCCHIWWLSGRPS